MLDMTDEALKSEAQAALTELMADHLNASVYSQRAEERGSLRVGYFSWRGCACGESVLCARASGYL